MDTIKAITDHDGQDQHHHCEAPKRSQDERLSNATRRAMAISFGATKRSHQWTQQRHCEDIVSIKTILIRRQQSSSKECQLPRRKRDEHNQQPGGPLNGKPQVDWAYSCLRSPATRMSRATTKHAMKNLQKNNKKCSHVTLAPHVMCVTLAGRAMQTIDWHRRERQQSKRMLWQQQWRQKLLSSFW